MRPDIPKLVFPTTPPEPIGTAFLSPRSLSTLAAAVLSPRSAKTVTLFMLANGAKAFSACHSDVNQYAEHIKSEGFDPQTATALALMDTERSFALKEDTLGSQTAARNILRSLHLRAMPSFLSEDCGFAGASSVMLPQQTGPDRQRLDVNAGKMVAPTFSTALLQTGPTSITLPPGIELNGHNISISADTPVGRVFKERYEEVVANELRELGGNATVTVTLPKVKFFIDIRNNTVRPVPSPPPLTPPGAPPPLTPPGTPPPLTPPGTPPPSLPPGTPPPSLPPGTPPPSLPPGTPPPSVPPSVPPAPPSVEKQDLDAIQAYQNLTGNWTMNIEVNVEPDGWHIDYKTENELTSEQEDIVQAGLRATLNRFNMTLAPAGTQFLCTGSNSTAS